MAFWGGAFAGILGLDLSQDPLKDWLERTSVNAGVCLAYELMSMALAGFLSIQHYQQKSMQSRKTFRSWNDGLLAAFTLSSWRELQLLFDQSLSGPGLPLKDKPSASCVILILTCIP